jgi:hypothetical protein
MLAAVCDGTAPQLYVWLLCCRAADGAPEPLLLLSPLLLMLSQDPFLLRHLGERQRYLPPVLAFSGYLAITSGVQVS